MACSSRVVVVVVLRDRFSIFPRCLDALYARTNGPFELVVVAGGTDRATTDYLRHVEASHTNAHLVLAESLLSQHEARVLAMHYVAGKFPCYRHCVVLENDTIVHEDWLPPMLQCMQEEGAAIVMPLILWYRGIHASGCTVDQQDMPQGAVSLRHSIEYTDIRRKRIDYPETHCVLIDRQQTGDAELFDDVEPFDVDTGLAARKYGLSVFVEPRSVVTYAAPPPWEARDIPAFRMRWDPSAWRARNYRFMNKWHVHYDASTKLASYRRQHLKSVLAHWYPSRATIALLNVTGGSLNRIAALTMGHPPPRPWRPSPDGSGV